MSSGIADKQMIDDTQRAGVEIDEEIVEDPGGLMRRLYIMSGIDNGIINADRDY